MRSGYINKGRNILLEQFFHSVIPDCLATLQFRIETH